MRMFGVVMFDRNPFKVGAEVVFHTFHQIARDTAQIGQIAKCRGDDQLPQSLVAASLPVLKPRLDIDRLLIVSEPYALYRVFRSGALACQVSAVRLPLTTCLVVQIGHPDGATLRVLRPFPPAVPRLW